jgi:hypothetical protein
MCQRTLRLLAALLLSLSIAACAASNEQQSGSSTPESGAAATGGEEGSSFEHAVVLADAKNEFEGVRAEHKWVQVHYPGWRWDTQSLLDHEGRVYDMIDISRGGEQRQIYFDITNWFGKLD